MTASRRRLLLFSLTVFALAVSGFWALGRMDRAVQAVQGEPVAITLTPSNLLLDPEGSLQLGVATGSTALGFARVELRFDPAVVTVERVETTTLLAPVTVSTAVEANATGRVVLALRATEGGAASGNVELATLHLSAAGELPEQRSTFTVDPARVQLVNRAGAEPPFTTATTRIGANPAAVSCLGVTEVPAAECEGLRAFYSATAGDTWGNWFSSDAPCAGWEGISCSGGHVTGLELPRHGVGGQLPLALAELSRLAVLNLEANDLGGPLPAELATLSGLRSLNLRANRLAGAIPPEMTALSQLQALDLGDNMLTARGAQLTAFLDDRDPDWAETQTVPPARLAIAGRASSEIILAWEPVVAGVAGAFYEVYIASAAAGPYLFHGSSATTAVDGYTLAGLAPNTTYFFKVRTYAPGGTERHELFSAYTPVLSAGTTLPPPAGLSATTGFDLDAIRLQWEPVAGAAAYAIYRASSPTGIRTQVGRVTGTGFADSTAAAAKIYFYWLTTCNERGCSEFSPRVYGWRGEIPSLFMPVVSRPVD